MGVGQLSSNQKITLDIVIPSFRADVKVLESIRMLSFPENLVRNIIVILDDPTHPLPEELDSWNSSPHLFIVRNEVNLGASGARNRGIEEARSDWVLFLDDDIQPEPDLLHVYMNTIVNRGGDAPGFVGVTRLPNSVNNFTKGIVASDILTFFDMAEYRNQMPWGVTANLLVRRDSIGKHRFRTLFPKSGGGEDIDFCLEIVKSSGRNFSTEPKAVVHHPWWNDAKRTYRRFFRWAYGDSNLPALHPKHRWRNFPNTAEILTVFLISIIPLYLIFGTSPQIISIALCGLIIGDFVTEWLRLILIKSIFNPIIAIESSCVRFSNDLGRTKAVIESLKPWRITERFDYAATGEWIRGERKWAVIRILIQSAFIYFILEKMYYG